MQDESNSHSALLDRNADLYLDLLKKSLLFSLWPEPPVPIAAFNDSRAKWKRHLISSVLILLRSRNLGLVLERNISAGDREEGKIWPGYAHTMIGRVRLDNLHYCVETALRENVPGHLIETGVWRGGACILMQAILKARGEHDRKVFVADSFEGLPKPDAEKHPMDAGDVHHIHSFLSVSQEQVEENFRKYNLLDENVVFVKGWFKDTLHRLEAEQFAVIRLDGDMYGSTVDALNALYLKLAPGGFCIIDDYALPGCQKAVDDFREQNDINSELQIIDYYGRFWRKEISSESL